MLCKVLAALRERHGRTKADVAAALRVSRVTVDSWENPGAGNRRPSADNMEALLDFLGASDAERLEAWAARAAEFQALDEEPAGSGRDGWASVAEQARGGSR